MGPKAVLFEISGTPKVGDYIILSYRSPRGGRTDARHDVTKEGETPESIAANLVNLVDKDWMKEAFSGNLNKARVAIHCTGLVGDVKFGFEVKSDALKVEQQEI